MKVFIIILFLIFAIVVIVYMVSFLHWVKKYNISIQEEYNNAIAEKIKNSNRVYRVLYTDRLTYCFSLQNALNDDWKIDTTNSNHSITILWHKIDTNHNINTVTPDKYRQKCGENTKNYGKKETF